MGYYLRILIVTCFNVCVCVFASLQQLESLVWERAGNLFLSSHNDGSYSVWAVTSSNTCSQQPVSSTIPYGEKSPHRRTLHICVVCVTDLNNILYLLKTCSQRSASANQEQNNQSCLFFSKMNDEIIQTVIWSRLLKMTIYNLTLFRLKKQL